MSGHLLGLLEPSVVFQVDRDAGCRQVQASSETTTFGCVSLQIIWRIFLHAIWRMDAAATTGSRELVPIKSRILYDIMITYNKYVIVIAKRSQSFLTLALRIGRISDLLKILLAYFTFSWKKELHVVAGDLSGTNDIAGSTRMVAWVDRGA